MCGAHLSVALLMIVSLMFPRQSLVHGVCGLPLHAFRVVDVGAWQLDIGLVGGVCTIEARCALRKERQGKY